MSSKRLKAMIAVLLVNALVSAGYVVALRQGVSLPLLRADTRPWPEVVPDVAFLSVLSLLAAYSMLRRTPRGFAFGMLTAGAYIAAPGMSVLRFCLELAHVGAAPGAPAAPPPPVPFVSIYFCLFGIVLAIYLWTRRHVFAVGV